MNFYSLKRWVTSILCAHHDVIMLHNFVQHLTRGQSLSHVFEWLVAERQSAFLFSPIYQVGHTENHLLSLHKITFTRSKYHKNIQFDLETKFTDGNRTIRGCVCSVLSPSSDVEPRNLHTLGLHQHLRTVYKSSSVIFFQPIHR